ncbi:hypothetical protein BCR43DRAFT_518753 [Syncephalastrum racemosum]|uniref:Uncharacterized protein n=1 Tax=Syncephalastrum racemosum TaxID=13706 RepID=A0A1X2H1X2_SYNRA|nr:hypothetical protein BCR43DRAFT_518753 [Syncephalastrum racemosum]
MNEFIYAAGDDCNNGKASPTNFYTDPMHSFMNSNTLASSPTNASLPSSLPSTTSTAATATTTNTDPALFDIQQGGWSTHPAAVNPISCDLQDVLLYYRSQPELLRLILLSKVEEDKRRAAEAKVRAKELDVLLLQQTAFDPATAAAAVSMMDQNTSVFNDPVDAQHNVRRQSTLLDDRRDSMSPDDPTPPSLDDYSSSTSSNNAFSPSNSTPTSILHMAR